MNTYKFTVEHPECRSKVEYTLEIATKEKIAADYINSAINKWLSTPTRHEDIADILFNSFGGMQLLTSINQGDQITTLRETSEGEIKTSEVMMRAVGRIGGMA